MMMQYDQFEASDGVKLHRTHWPCDSPHAFVHIVHGMAEHCDRYDRLARRLNAEGFAVYAHDQRGHARTAALAGVALGNIATRAEREGGRMGVPGGDGFMRMVLDVEELLAAEQAEQNEQQQQQGQERKVKKVQCMLLGHSMGSIVAQLVAGRSGAALGISALILSGAPARPVFPLKQLAVPVLVPILSLLSGGVEGITSIPTALSFGEFAKRTVYTAEEQSRIAAGTLAATEFDWLSHDPEEVAKYIADEHCGHLFTVGYWKDFITGLLRLSAPASADGAQPAAMAGLAEDTPVMVIIGGSDPCHEDFLALRQISAEFRAAGRRMPRVVVVGEGRHELFNELEPEREQAVAEVVRFFAEAGHPRSRM